MKRALATLLAMAAFAASGGVVRAEDVTPVIVIRAHDPTGTPVRDALVRLFGSSAQHTHVGRTDDEGKATFAGSRCESGLLLVEAAGFSSIRQHVSCEGAVITIDVLLQPQLAKIGGTHSSSPPSAKVSVSVGPESPVRRISPTLVEALDQLAGLSAQDRGIGFNASIRGQSAALTEYALNGVPLGSGASLAVNSDLLTSASVDEASDAIALFTASPTTTSQFLAELRLGSYEDSFSKFQTTGTVHGDGMGYVVVHTSRGLASELNGQTYADESGLNYLHSGLRHATGNLVRLNNAVGATSISMTYSASTTSAQDIPTYFSGTLPAGSGPGTHRDETSSNPVLFVAAPLAGGQLSISAARWNFATWTDATSRLLALSPAPSSTFDRTAGTNTSVTFSTAPSRNRAIVASLSRETSSTSGTSFGTVAGIQFGAPFTLKDRRLAASLGEDWHGSLRLPFALSVKGEKSDALGGAIELDANAQFIMSPHARIRYSGTFGSKLIDLASSQTSNVLSDPAAAQYDCAERAAFVTGPGASGTKTHAANHDLGVSYSGRRSNITMTFYQHRYDNVSIGSVPLVAASLPGGYFPNDYLATVEQLFASAGGCRGNLSPSSIFVQEAFAGGGAVYRGLTTNIHTTLSDTVSLDANLGIERARTTNGDARLVATPFFSGSPIPGVAAYKGNLILGWGARDGKTTALVSTSVVGPYNSRQLPPYAVVNAALERRISPSSVAAVLISNVFDTLTSPFISTRFAVPLKDGSGREIPTLASPLLPRRIEFRYTVRTGGSDLPH